MSHEPRFEDAPEYHAAMDAHRQQLLATIEAAWHRIAEASIEDLLDTSFEVSKGLADLSYAFCIHDYQIALRRWMIQQGQRTRQMALLLNAADERERV